MKIKINRMGFLFIERAGEMKAQMCPYRDMSNCGDWCPLFNIETKNEYENAGMPSMKDGEIVLPEKKLKKVHHSLQLCGTIYNFVRNVDIELITDERDKGK